MHFYSGPPTHLLSGVDSSVRSILDNKLDRQTAQSQPADPVPVLHPNIRGPRYYH